MRATRTSDVAAAPFTSSLTNASVYTFMSGTHVEEIALARGRSVVGSLKSCSAPSTEKSEHMTIAGRIMGSLTRSAVCSSPAPSSLAASYISRGNPRTAVYSTTMLKPTTPPHGDVRDREEDLGAAEEVDDVAADRARRGQVEEPPHSREAMTPGTA